MRVIVADDEELIRTGIIDLIKWEELGYEVVGEAEDGEEALSLVSELKPEVVITDIKMPFVTGLELLKNIKNKYEPLYVVLLTGYDEFKFAQEAVNSGAYAYLLKPVDPLEIEKILKDIKESFEKKSVAERYTKELKTEQHFKNLLYGMEENEEIELFLRENGYDANDVYFNTFMIEIDDHLKLSQSEYTDWITSIKTYLFDIVNNESKKISKTVLMENKGLTFTVITWGESIDTLETNLRDVIDKIRKSISDKHISFSVAIGGTYQGVQSIKRSYDEAIKALSIKFLVGKNKDIFFKDFIHELDEKESEEFDLDGIIGEINFESKENVISSLDSIMKDIKNKGTNSYIYVQLIITNIFIHSLQLLRKAEVDIEKMFGNPIEKFEEILIKETAEEKIESLKNLLRDMYAIIESSRLNTSSSFIIKAEEYINENYSKKSLSLNDVIKYVAISQAHFCIEFKKKTGETFVDYLTRVRMVKARELLTLSDRKIYEISELVGYDNSTYFSTLFKKHYDLSPSEFRNTLT